MRRLRWFAAVSFRFVVEIDAPAVGFRTRTRHVFIAQARSAERRQGGFRFSSRVCCRLPRKLLFGWLVFLITCASGVKREPLSHLVGRHGLGWRFLSESRGRNENVHDLCGSWFSFRSTARCVRAALFFEMRDERGRVCCSWSEVACLLLNLRLPCGQKRLPEGLGG